MGCEKDLYKFLFIFQEENSKREPVVHLENNLCGSLLIVVSYPLFPCKLYPFYIIDNAFSKFWIYKL